METAPPSVISVLSTRVRRGLLIAGLGGFAAIAGGAFIAAPVMSALIPWAEKSHPVWIVALVNALTSRFWVYAMLPGLWLGVSRWLRDLRPWSAAFWSVAFGEVFYLMLDQIGDRLGLVIHHPSLWIPRVVTLVAGVVLSERAIRWPGAKKTT